SPGGFLPSRSGQVATRGHVEEVSDRSAGLDTYRHMQWVGVWHVWGRDSVRTGLHGPSHAACVMLLVCNSCPSAELVPEVTGAISVRSATVALFKYAGEAHLGTRGDVCTSAWGRWHGWPPHARNRPRAYNRHLLFCTSRVYDSDMSHENEKETD